MSEALKYLSRRENVFSKPIGSLYSVVSFYSCLLIHRLNREENEEFGDIERANLHQGDGMEVPIELPVHSDIREHQSPSSDPEEDVTHGEPGQIETSILGEVKYISTQSPHSFLPSPKRKLRQPARQQQTGQKTYGNRKSSEHQQPAAKARMPRRPPVEELQLVPDRVPSNPIYESHSKSASIP